MFLFKMKVAPPCSESFAYHDLQGPVPCNETCGECAFVKEAALHTLTAPLLHDRKVSEKCRLEAETRAGYPTLIEQVSSGKSSSSSAALHPIGDLSWKVSIVTWRSRRSPADAEHGLCSGTTTSLHAPLAVTPSPVTRSTPPGCTKTNTAAGTDRNGTVPTAVACDDSHEKHPRRTADPHRIKAATAATSVLDGCRSRRWSPGSGGGRVNSKGLDRREDPITSSLRQPFDKDAL